MQRILTFDLARGFTVLIMPSVHCILVYSHPSVYSSPLATVFAFLAEGPGAPLFMFLMGASVPLSSSINQTTIIKRTFYFAAIALTLNALKFMLPARMGMLPDVLVADLALQDNNPFFPGDIFHFACIAFPIISLLYRFNHYQYWSLIIVIAIMILSPMVWDVKSDFVFVNYLLQLVAGHPPAVYFPIFPWLIFPLAGLSFGYFVKHHALMNVMGVTGVTGVACIILAYLFPSSVTTSFYRTNPSESLYHLGLVLLWLFFLHQLSKFIHTTLVTKLLCFCSKHITLIYFLQWIFIFWCVPFAGYQQLGLIPTVCWMLSMTILVLFLTYVLTYAKRKQTL